MMINITGRGIEEMTLNEEKSLRRRIYKWFDKKYEEMAKEYFEKYYKPTDDFPPKGL